MGEAVGARTGAELVLGRYRPLRPLGSGGSGSVWLAWDERSGLRVALKIVAREGTAAARAEREAVAASRLRHERCLRAYGVGRDERHVYIAYEYVPGRTLRQAMRAGELDDASALEAAAQILDGLAHAHSRGIVHRDVKPANVQLGEGPGVAVRLLDFGLAQMDEGETLTAIGDVPGTLAYIAPERLAGRPATAASDVWSVGVLLFEALAGGHPFWKASPLAAARAIEAGAPPLASLRPDLPKALLAAVDCALARDPARRPSAAALAGALRSAGAKRPRTRARTAPALPRPSRAAAMRAVPPLERAAAAAVTGLAGGFGATLLPFFPRGWAVALGIAVALASLLRPRAGLALALATPVLPLGNLSLGLALAYGALAALWLVVFAREPRWGLLPALGPVLALVAALGLVPLAVQPLRSPLRRFVAALAAVLLAGLAAGLAGAPLPPAGSAPPLGLGLAGSEDPVAAAGALWRALLGQQALLAAGLALAAAAAALPYARRPFAVAAWGAATLAATLLLVPGAPALPLVAAVWATCAVWSVRVRS